MTWLVFTLVVTPPSIYSSKQKWRNSYIYIYMPFQMCSRATGWFFFHTVGPWRWQHLFTKRLNEHVQKQKQVRSWKIGRLFFFFLSYNQKKKKMVVRCVLFKKKKSSVPNTLICQHETAVWCYYAKRRRLKETGLLPYFRDCNDSLAKNIWIYPLQSRWKKKTCSSQFSDCYWP